MAFFDQLPKYITTRQRIMSTVFFTAFFGMVFQLLTVPFIRNTWFEINSTPAAALTLIFELVSLGVVILSKWMIYISQHNGGITYLNYGLRSFGEAVVISSLYTFLTIEGYDFGLLVFESTPNALMVFCGSLVFCVLCLGFSYVVTAQYFAIMDKNNTIKLMNYSSVVTDAEVLPAEEQKMTLYDDSGALKLSVSISNIFYVESDDNYVKVWYSDASGAMRQYMLRCRLRTIEESFSGSDLVRCHRKYIVNIRKIEVLRHEKEGYVIDLGLSSVDGIPVSRTYEEKILSIFNSR